MLVVSEFQKFKFQNLRILNFEVYCFIRSLNNKFGSLETNLYKCLNFDSFLIFIKQHPKSAQNYHKELHHFLIYQEKSKTFHEVEQQTCHIIHTKKFT